MNFYEYNLIGITLISQYWHKIFILYSWLNFSIQCQSHYYRYNETMLFGNKDFFWIIGLNIENKLTKKTWKKKELNSFPSNSHLQKWKSIFGLFISGRKNQLSISKKIIFNILRTLHETYKIIIISCINFKYTIFLPFLIKIEISKKKFYFFYLLQSLFVITKK